MIKIVNAIKTELYTIESAVEKTVTTNLRFNKRTNDFLESLLEYKKDQMKMSAQMPEMQKVVATSQSKDTNIEEMSNDQLENLINLGTDTLDLQSQKLKLMIESVILIGLETEYENGDLTSQDIAKIFELISTEPNLQIPL